MIMQLHLARGVVNGRVHSDQDPVQLRDVELASREARRVRRAAARRTRQR
ncbi:hypothetical protein [Nocardioides sp. cx-173]|nr:hypothetical protein [Nocardioides sp. cx-173]MCD4526844.1 hypothetical protein [Nocardioides sp. cx-173]UGB43945.1 hypothetical protein LQ940_10610 [Nocardioides sp. cx-173]